MENGILEKQVTAYRSSKLKAEQELEETTRSWQLREKEKEVRKELEVELYVA